MKKPRAVAGLEEIVRRSSCLQGFEFAFVGPEKFHRSQHMISALFDCVSHSVLENFVEDGVLVHRQIPMW